MSRRRSFKAPHRFSREPSYFTTCKYCGVKIHMRQMPHDQWVAFDGSEIVHHCGRGSDYDNLPFQNPSQGRSPQLQELHKKDGRKADSGFRSHRNSYPYSTQNRLTKLNPLNGLHTVLTSLFSLAMAVPMLAVSLTMMAVASIFWIVFRYWWVFAILITLYALIIPN